MTANPITPSAPSQATLLRVDDPATLPTALAALGFEEPRPTLVVIGGASKLSEADFAKVAQLFTQVLAPLAEARGLNVVDGGTDAGVMRLMGEGRAHVGGSFPLVGVAPVGLVALPDQPVASKEACPIEPHHTHCLLIPGDQWGDESSWMAAVATQLAGPCGSVALVINGGEITWKDAISHAQTGRPLVVLAGSGRTADILAAAARGGPVVDPRAAELVASHSVQVVDLAQPEALRSMLTGLLKP